MTTELWTPLDLGKMPATANVKPEYINKYPDGRVAGVGAVTWYITLVTNTKTYPEAPTSWKALWDPANKDSLGLLALATNSFLLEVTAKTYFGGTDFLSSEENILKVMDKIAELKPNVKLWYRDEAQFEQALKSGEIPMGQYYHDVTGLAAADGHPVRSTFPEEGGINDGGSWAVTKASTMVEEAHVFIDYMSKPETQATLSRKVGTSPTVNREVLDLTPEEFASVASDIPPIIPRYDLYQEKSDWLNQKWTELIVG
jgi:putative spermidine/putrescine transport system substrate-binding protein